MHACRVPGGRRESRGQQTMRLEAVRESDLSRISDCKTNALAVKAVQFFQVWPLANLRKLQIIGGLTPYKPWNSTKNKIKCRQLHGNLFPNSSKRYMAPLFGLRVFLSLAELAWVSHHGHVRSMRRLTWYPPSACSQLQDSVRAAGSQGDKGKGKSSTYSLATN